MGRYFYNHAYEIYESEKSKANNYFKRIVLKLNTPSILKVFGFLLIALGFIGIIVVLFSLIKI